MTNVTFVLPSFAGGGAERVVINIAAAFADIGPSPTLVVLSGQGPLRAIVPPSVPVVDLARGRLRQGAPALLGHLRRTAPDVIFSTLPHVNLFLCAVRSILPARTALVVRQSNALARGESPVAALKKAAYRHLYCRADGIIALSDAMRAELTVVCRLPAERITIVRNPVNVAELRAASIGSQPRRGSVELVAIGRLVPQKGFDRLIAMLGNVGGDWHLTILGEGPMRPALEHAIAVAGLRGRVELPGFVANVAPYLAASDALLVASRWEGMPNVVLEALACGAPAVVARNLAAVRELAALAAPGAIQFYETEAELGEAVANISGRSPDRERPSLLPPEHDFDLVLPEIVVLIDRAIEARRRLLHRSASRPA